MMHLSVDLVLTVAENNTQRNKPTTTLHGFHDRLSLHLHASLNFQRYSSDSHWIFTMGLDEGWMGRGEVRALYENRMDGRSY